MNKLERETENACINVISKRKGRGAFFVASYGYGPDDFYKKDEAKAAAEAECARLNAAYRREMGK